MAIIYFKGEGKENAITVKKETAEEMAKLSGGKLVIEYLD